MDQTVQNQTQARKIGIEQIAYFILGGLALLLPFFLIPSRFVGLGLSKGLLISLGAVFALAFFIISTIKSGQIEVPKNLMFLSTALIPVAFLLSAIFNGSSQASFLGYVFEIGTVSSIFFGFLILFLASQMFRSKERIFYSYLGLFLSFGIITLYHIIRFLFGPEVLSFGFLNNPVSNLVGSWNDLSIYFGAVAILSLVTLEMVVLNKVFKTLISSVFALSIVFLAIVNFSTMWFVLGIFSLVFFLYIISFDHFYPSKELGHGADLNSQPTSNRKISYKSLAVLIVSVLFIFAGSPISDRISSILNIANVEVRPSWGATLEITGNVLKQNPIFGSGPNNFTNEWLLNKPEGINETLFWNTDFSYGTGLLPTFMVTTGALGILAWVFFLGMILYTGIRAMFKPTEDLFSRYLVVSSFLLSIFFWLTVILYVPGIANFGLAFFFTGLFMASLYRENLLQKKTFSLATNPKISFVSVLVLIVLLIGTVVLGYLVGQKSVSFVYFQKSLVALNEEQNLDRAESYMVKAVELGGLDIYYRGLSELNLVRINTILNREGATFDSVRDEFQATLANSIENARISTTINPQNYQNWISLARVYAELVPPPFSIPGAYENAKAAYEEALKSNPHNPAIYLLLSRLEISNNNLAQAREYAQMSIEKKQNYADGHFVISQIEVAEGNLDPAISSLETTLILSPGNPGLFFQLGILKYNKQDFIGAIGALARAVELVPEYANAKYFLGLSLSRVGETALAIEQFEGIEVTNPDNEEVKIILENLRAGREPFANVQPPLDNRPEQRPSLPIEEGS